MERVRQQHTVHGGVTQHAAQITRCEIGAHRDDLDVAPVQRSKRADGAPVPVDGVDPASRCEEVRERARERAGAGAKVRPDAAAASDGGRNERNGIVMIHDPE